MAADPEPIRRRVFDLIERVDRKALAPRIIAGLLIALILVNVFAAVFETVPALVAGYRWVFRLIEAVSLAVFTLEYLVRLWVSVEHPRARGMPAWRARLAYALTPAAIVDLIAVVPFFVEAFTDTQLRVIVLLRLLRLFKLGRYSTGFQSLLEAVRRERDALLASFLILISVILVAASFAYMAERATQPDGFGSIPEALWWAVSTVTTVGYGDVVPKTDLGRLIGGLTMISGILMIALPVAIIGSSFAEVVRQRSFVITFAMVARLPLFSNLGPQLLSELLPMLRAVTLDAGAAIVDHGDDGDIFYVVADGIVEVEYPHGRRRLTAGDAFGADPGSAAPGGGYPALALTRVRLLALDRIDLIHLIDRHPELADVLRPDRVEVAAKAG